MSRGLAQIGGFVLRGLPRLLAASSLLLCLGLSALLLDPGGTSREAEYHRPRAEGGSVWGGYAFDGRLYLGVVDGRAGECALAPGASIDADPGWGRSMLYRGLMHRPCGAGRGFGAADVSDLDARLGGEILGLTGVRVRGVMVPHGFAACLTAVAPMAWGAARLRRRRPARGDDFAACVRWARDLWRATARAGGAGACAAEAS